MRASASPPRRSTRTAMPREPTRRGAGSTTATLRLLFVSPERLAVDGFRGAPAGGPASGAWPSTRRIASRNGATTSAPNTAALARRPRRRSAACRTIALTATADARHAAPTSSPQLFAEGAADLRPLLRPAQPRPPLRRQGPAAPADRRFPRPRRRARAASSTPPRATRPSSSPSISPRRAIARSPYHAGLDQARAQRHQDVFLARGRRGDGGDRRLRHGHQQARRALRRPRRHAGRHRGATTRRSAAPAATGCRPTR